MAAQDFENPFKAIYNFTKDQKKGVLLLFVIIVILQITYYFVDFSTPHVASAEELSWLAQQPRIDSMKSTYKKTIYKIYPFNPNFITDFKGAKLGMSVAEIDRLLNFRKTGKFANSPEEFQKVTGISDSLLSTIAPYFKFPDWVNNKQKFSSNYKPFVKFAKKPDLKILEINLATKEDLMNISGIGEALSDRILNQKQTLGAFVAMEQLDEIWGLSPEVLVSLKKYFKLTSIPNINKINVNSASIKQLSQFYYFKGPVSRNIVLYRSMNGDIKIEDLTNIKGFPVDKVKIIALYLEF